MRTSTLLGCLFTWLATTITTVQCQKDYLCSNGVVVEGRFIQAAVDDIPNDSESDLYAAGAVPVENGYLNFWWKVIPVPQSYFVSETRTTYRLVFDQNKNIRNVQLVYHYTSRTIIDDCREV
ncbi:putative candidate secreted effector protein [Blumeria hordei DH14]|uniref:Putative candidate secreted effector protein n=1 Tax=Blumeria graminis f. sp. hordei (strain DH14) TaxID=546991 RepID=N1JA18_BLUG1|nr:putative candidate secreted effector protein [Blumeria hordei DH14]